MQKKKLKSMRKKRFRVMRHAVQ